MRFFDDFEWRSVFLQLLDVFSNLLGVFSFSPLIQYFASQSKCVLPEYYLHYKGIG